MKEQSAQSLFEQESIGKILLHMAPPVMLAQLIQSMYNIVDSYFVGQYSGDGLTALSVIYPIQLIITAIAVGTGVGVNTQMSQDYAHGRTKKAYRVAGTGLVLAVISWVIFAIVSALIIRPYSVISASSPQAVEYAVTYGHIVCIGSLGVFLESVWSKVHQARGNMSLPMLAQVAGALTNIVLDPLLIFGKGPFPALGIAGAGYATVAGQLVSALITVSALHKPPKLEALPAYARRIYYLGFPSIFMQLLFTVYILALNMILASFCDEAVTVLGLYYKLQSFFFIPLNGLQTCIVPLLSYTYAKHNFQRCKKILWSVMLVSMGFMLVGIVSFELIPAQLLGIFAKDSATAVFEIGVPALRIIGTSFLPAVVSLTMPIFFQAIGAGKPSILLSLTRQIFCLIPIFWLLSKIGLMYAWAAFPLSELICGSVGLYLLNRQLRQWKIYESKYPDNKRRNTVMKMITAVISKKDSDEVCGALAEAGYYFTKMATSGGFLSGGNTTLIIGTEADRVQQAVDIIRSNCSKRTEKVPTTIQLGSRSVSSTPEVVVGGATVFVTEVEQFEKM